MSFGELSSMYERGELIINPEYQRLFRWTHEKRTAFVESLLLNIPIPAIFVFTKPDGVWELVDGLQRVSTVFELMGILQDAEGGILPRLVCGTSDLLPGLSGRFWPKDGEGNSKNAFTPSQHLAIRRSRIRVEILDQQTDPDVKFELFQRLNTGGTNLSEQEVRNCVIASLDSDVYNLMLEMVKDQPFVDLTEVGSEREKRQYRLELIVRFFVLRHFAYSTDVDIHRYLDRGMVHLLENLDFNWKRESDVFSDTMALLFRSAGVDSFRTNKRFSLGKYEFAVVAVSKLVESKAGVNLADLASKIAQIPDLPEAKKYSGGGVKGGTRLSKFVLKVAPTYLV